MKIGDKVRLNEKGQNVRVDSMADWIGEVVGFRGQWVKVLWAKARGKECAACGGRGEVCHAWEEHPDFLEKI